MNGRTLGLLVLVAAAGVATPWLMHEPVATSTAMATPVAKPLAKPDPHARLRAAVAAAAQDQVPGARGSGWVLHRLERSEPGIDGRERIRATGVISWPGTPDTQVALSGRYDPATGELVRVAYTLEAPEAPVADAAWSVELAVQQALSAQLSGQQVGFALDSAQSTRLEDGGRRFEGFGIGTWGNGEARFVSFTLALSADGQPVAFDYGAEMPDGTAPMIAGY